VPPTIDEIRDILDAADARGKALTLMLLTGGLREGVIQSLFTILISCQTNTIENNGYVVIIYDVMKLILIDLRA